VGVRGLLARFLLRKCEILKVVMGSPRNQKLWLADGSGHAIAGLCSCGCFVALLLRL
jgi:hypothetical protein